MVVSLLGNLKENFDRKLDIQIKSKKEGHVLVMAKDAMQKGMSNVALCLRQKILAFLETEHLTPLEAK